MNIKVTFSIVTLLFILLIEHPGYALQVGEKVKCQYRGIGNMYRATVTGINGEAVQITYDDGEKGTVPAKACRLLTTKELNPVKKDTTNIVDTSGKLTRLESNSSSGWDNWTIH